MSYDFDGVKNKSAPKVNNPIPASDDLEAIVILLDLAAIALTDKPGDSFTVPELFKEALKWGCGEIVPSEKDLLIVFNNYGKAFRYMGCGRYCMR